MTLTKEEAKNMNILDVANSLGMNMLKSSRNEYYWDEHDSFKINTSKNMFRWYSKDIGGDVIQMIQTLRGVSFREAINYLDTGNFEEAKVQEVTREPFKYLLEKYETDFDNGRRYLKEIRGLSDNTIDFFLKEKALALVNRKYQDGYSEQVLVFKYFDDNQNIIGGTLQGIVPNKDKYEGKGYLKQIIYNSDGTAGVNVTVGEKADRLIFFEAPIDMMSYYELNKHNLNNVKLISMDGLKESTIARYLTEHIITDEAMKKTLDFSNTVGYMNFIIKDTDYFDGNKNADVITLAVDNDSAGRNFIEKLEKIGLKFQTELPPQLKNKEKTDWNEVLIVQKKLEKSKGEINMEQNTENKTIEELNAPFFNKEKVNNFDSKQEQSVNLQKLVDSKKLNQWQKQPEYYFVKGLRKVAVKLENGRLRLSKKYPPKNDNEKQYLKDLLEGKDVSISEIRLQQLPENTPKEEKEIKEKLLETSNLFFQREFEIKALKRRIIPQIIMTVIVLISMFAFEQKKLSFDYLFKLVLVIGICAFIFYRSLRKFQNSKYSLYIKGNTVKIFYENNEKEIITTENINYVSFFALRRGKRGKERKPTLQLFDLEERILAEMTIEVIDYFRLKRYLKKYNVEIVDNYEWS